MHCNKEGITDCESLIKRICTEYKKIIKSFAFT